MFPSEFINKLRNILFIYPFLWVTAVAAYITDYTYCGKNSHSRVDDIPWTVCTGFSFDADNSAAFAFGAFIGIFHFASLIFASEKKSADCRCERNAEKYTDASHHCLQNLEYHSLHIEKI